MVSHEQNIKNLLCFIFEENMKVDLASWLKKHGIEPEIRVWVVTECFFDGTPNGDVYRCFYSNDDKTTYIDFWIHPELWKVGNISGKSYSILSSAEFTQYNSIEELEAGGIRRYPLKPTPQPVKQKNWWEKILQNFSA